MKQQCPFRPEINYQTVVEKDFSVRQEEFLNNLKSKITAQLEERKFKPEINRISELLTK